MKLFYAIASPFARKVRVVIAEKQIAGIEEIHVSPFDLPPELVAANPLSKVPSLLLQDGTVVYDSPVICEYLDSISGAAPRLIPASGSQRWNVMRLHALCDGLMDTCLALSLEINRRPEGERSPQWIASWCKTIQRTANALETEIDQFSADIHLGHIALGCALGYLDLRASNHVRWRDANPRLAEWYLRFEQRPSMQSTRPV
jgi:glutathione S-transferase